MINSVPKSVQRWLQTKEVLGPSLTIGPLTRRAPAAPSEWFVDAQGGGDTRDGRDPNAPLKTVAAALALAKSGDTIYVVGNITEEITASNLLEDISIIGVANRPRHADKARDFASFPTYKGISGCSWRQAASHGVTTPLLKIRGQGWHIENILFVPPSDAAAIFLDRNALSDVSEFDASHLTVKGCRFAGGQSGIEDSGGNFNVSIENSVFHAATNAIKTLNTAVAQPLMWTVKNCLFTNNTNHLLVDATQWQIIDNVFGKFTTQSVKLDQIGNAGGANVISRNALSGTYSIAGGYKSNAATDEWGGNYNSIAGGVTAADPA